MAIYQLIYVPKGRRPASQGRHPYEGVSRVRCGRGAAPRLEGDKVCKPVRSLAPDANPVPALGRRRDGCPFRLPGRQERPGAIGAPGSKAVPELRVLPPAQGALDLSAAPTFRIANPIATGFLGEPTLVANANGSLFLTFPGCPSDRKECSNGPVYRSDDDGSHWTFLNPLANGSLAAKSPKANGDAMLALDAKGTLYASNLKQDGTGTPMWSSSDNGVSWTYRSNPVPKGNLADRQWAWGGPAGIVVEDWMQTSPTRSAAIAVSRDSGAHFSTPFVSPQTIGWIGPATGSADGSKLFAAFTVPSNSQKDPTGDALLVDPDVELFFLRSLDGGATWSSLSTGHVLVKDPAHLQWPGTLMAPMLGRTGSGRLVYAWSEENMDPATRATGTAAVVKTMTSDDDGKTWTDARIVSASRTAIMPWFVAGAGNSFGLSYYAASDVHALNDYEGTWDVELYMSDGARSVTTVAASQVHKGGICARGGVCGLGLSDRSMLDFMGGALLADGRIALAYASSSGMPGPSTSGLVGGTGTSAVVAVQQAGARLLP